MRRLPFVGLACVVLGGVLALCWYDVLPGGWRLRRLFGAGPPDQAAVDARRIADHLARFREENPRVPAGSIVFLGSSTIERFPLALEFPGKPCVNRGIANLSARDLARILPDCLPAATPRAFFVYVGAADWRGSSRDARVLVERVDAVLAALERTSPTVPVLLSGILPERGMGPDAVLALEVANSQLANVARDHGADFLDPARPPLSDPEGALRAELSVDEFHLNEEGYRILAGFILEGGGTVGRLLARNSDRVQDQD